MALQFILNSDLTPKVWPEMKERLGKIFLCFEYPFKAMVKETSYPERMADLGSYYLQKVHMVGGTITVLATSSEFACSGIGLSNLSAPSCFWVTQNQQRWQKFRYFWTDLCFLQHEVPSDSACLSCLSCEYFAAAATQPGEGEDPAAASLIPLPSGFISFLACMAKRWAV